MHDAEAAIEAGVIDATSVGPSVNGEPIHPAFGSVEASAEPKAAGTPRVWKRWPTCHHPRWRSSGSCQRAQIQQPLAPRGEKWRSQQVRRLKLPNPQSNLPLIRRPENQVQNPLNRVWLGGWPVRPRRIISHPPTHHRGQSPSME